MPNIESDPEVKTIQHEIFSSVVREHWFARQWRPAMAWSYFIICLFDFLIAPILMGIFAYYTKSTITVWEPLTLKGGGLYHISMAAIVGITVFGRTQEKINGVSEDRQIAFDTPQARDEFVEDKKRKLQELKARAKITPERDA